MKVLRRSPRQLLLAALLAASALSCALPREVSSLLRMSLRWALDPLGDAGMYARVAVSDAMTDLHHRASDSLESDLPVAEARALRDENARLRRAMEELRRKYAVHRRRQLEARRLYGQLGIDRLQWDLIAGRVVGIDSIPYGQSRAVNAGSSRGVVSGSKATTRTVLTDRLKALLPGPLAAITTEALVGEVVETWRFGARMRLITDPGFQVNALVKRVVDPDNPRRIVILERGNAQERPLGPDDPRVDVLVAGDGTGGLIARDVPEIHRIRAGDLVFLKETDRFLPARIGIGRVSEVKTQPRNPRFAVLRIEPFADLTSLREVYIVVPTLSGRSMGDE